MKPIAGDLDFFISPITGRSHNDGPLISDATFILQHPYTGLPNAQALDTLRNGMLSTFNGVLYATNLFSSNLWIGDSNNVPQEVKTIGANNMPDLTATKIWRGGTDIFDPDNYNRPVEDDSLTVLEAEMLVVSAVAYSAQSDAIAAFALATSAMAAAAAAFTLAELALPKTGGTMTGSLILYGDATSALEAVTLEQMEAAIVGGGSYKVSCYVSTTVNLNATYANGSSGVGATLTNASAFAAFALDGTSPPINSRILVKNQTTTYENGCYVLTVIGDAISVNWVLTRSSDYDTIPEIHIGDIFPVINGTQNHGTSWLQIDSVSTIGTSPIQFIQFGYNANQFLQVTNNLSDLNNVPLARTNLGLTNIAIQTVTQHAVLVGGASNAITSISVPVTANQVFVSGASADPIWSSSLSALTSIVVGNLSLSGNTISSTNTNGNIILTPNGSGQTQITNLILNADATDPLGAVTLEQLQSYSFGLTFKDTCYASSTVNLTVIYNNGIAGIGATLINAGTLAIFTIDGTTPPVNSRILIKDQTIDFQNGIYVVTIAGTSLIAWVLTRSSDYNTVSEIHVGDVVPIENGTKNALSSWIQTNSVNVIGTDAIDFSAFTYAPYNFLQVINNLSDLNNITTARTNLGLTNVAIQNVTQYNVLIGGTSNTITSISPSTSGYILTSNGISANPTFQAAPASGITTVNADSGSCAPSAGAITISGGSTGLTTSASAATLNLTGTLGVNHGGSGVATLTGVLIGNGTSAFTGNAITQYNVLVGGASNAITSVAPSATNGFVLTSNGTSANPSFRAAGALAFQVIDMANYTYFGGF